MFISRLSHISLWLGEEITLWLLKMLVMTVPVLYNRAAHLSAFCCFAFPADIYHLPLRQFFFGIWFWFSFPFHLPCFTAEVTCLSQFIFVMFEYSSEAIYKGCHWFSLGCYNFLAKLKPSSFLRVSSCVFPGTCFNHSEEVLCSPNEKKGWLE